MAMQAPRFWFTPPGRPGWAARLLAPLGRAYARATARRLAGTAGARVAVPVICVGNLNAGGTGKTPTVVALAQRLAARGVVAHVVSRCFGGRLSGPVRVEERRHSAADVGDEPLLVAGVTPAWAGGDGAAGAGGPVAADAGAILLDAGFRMPGVAKDLSLMVVDAARGFGSGLCLPAGPLREPVAAGLRRADFVLSIGAAPQQVEFVR